MIEVEGHNVIMTKHFWPLEEVELALCNDITYDGGTKMVADLRVVCREALLSFFNNVFVDFMKADKYAEHRRVLFPKIKAIYQSVYDYFISTYYPRLNYRRDLYQHQKDVLATTMYRKSNLLALDMGTGKTITAASISKMYGIARTIVICPSLVKWNWFRDMCDDWDYNKIYWTILDAKRSRTQKAFSERFCVVNYEMAHKHLEYLVSRECGHIIIDECHKVKNATTRNFKSVQKIIQAFPNARVTLLSGTPVTNRVNDMFAYMKLVGHPLGKDYRKFISMYTIGNRGQVKGSKNVDDLKHKISNLMIRKRAEECVDLPPMIINNYVFKMDEHQEEYQNVLGELAQHIDETDAEQDSLKKQQGRIKVKANMHTLNRLVAMSKVPGIIELAENIIENGKKVIIFSSYTMPLEMLEKHFKSKCVRIDGSVDSLKRDQLIQKFKNDDEVTVFLGNQKAAGVGINLVNANDVIHTNFPFTPDDLEQPNKRAHRIGQTGPVRIYYTICEDTIDEVIYDIIVSKSIDINNLIDDNKQGVVHYDQIETKLFRELINRYKKSKGIPINENEFLSLK